MKIQANSSLLHLVEHVPDQLALQTGRKLRNGFFLSVNSIQSKKVLVRIHRVLLNYLEVSESRLSMSANQHGSCSTRVSGFGFWSSCFGFRVSGFGFRVSGFGFRVLGFRGCTTQGVHGALTLSRMCRVRSAGVSSSSS